jgi:isopenicillin-N epimerase
LQVEGSAVRDLWALDPDRLHLNHGSFGAVPRAALVHQADLRREMEGAPVAWFGALPDRIRTAREQVAAFLGVPAASTALVLNASAGVTAVLASLDLKWGSTIVLTDHAYGAVRYACERAAARVGGTVRIVRVPLEAESDEATQRIIAAFDPSTALVVLDQITSPTARFLPVAEVSTYAREHGILSLIDGAHSPGLMAAPVVTEADFWVGNLHKFACCPRGTAVLVVRDPGARTIHPTIDSWGAETTFPHSFDIQGTLDLTPWLAAPTALAVLQDTLGWDVIRDYSRAICTWGAEHVADAFSAAFGEDCRVTTGMPSQALSLVRLPSSIARTRVDADGLRDRFSAEYGCEMSFVAWSGSTFLRLSGHAYVVADDYQRLVEVALPHLTELAGAAPVAPAGHHIP